MEKRPYPEVLTHETVAGWISANCTPAFPRDAFEIIELYGQQQQAKVQEQLRVAVEALRRYAHEDTTEDNGDNSRAALKQIALMDNNNEKNG